MMKFVLLGLILISQSWAQDQVASTGARVSATLNGSSCPVQRNYFQQDLGNLAFFARNPKTDGPVNSRLLRIAPQIRPLIKPACVTAALENVSAGPPLRSDDDFRVNRFMRCHSQNKIIDHQDEPCLSEDYQTLIHASFELATSCLKEFVSGSKDPKIQNIWVEGYFKMLSKESGLHINAVSRIGAMGIGQLLPEYIADFHRRTLPRLREFLARPGGPAGCKRLGDEVLTEEKISALYRTLSQIDSRGRRVEEFQINRCATIDITDSQPLLNLLISFSHLQVFKESTVDWLMRIPKYRDALNELNDKSELHDLEIKLVSWAYNLGAEGLRTRAVQALKKRERGAPIKSVRDLIQTMAGGSRRHYLEGLEERYQLVRQGKRSCRTDQF
jgi:hypothetical protein